MFILSVDVFFFNENEKDFIFHIPQLQRYRDNANIRYK